MAHGMAPRALQVAAADATAKSRRAEEASSVSTVVLGASDPTLSSPARRALRAGGTYALDESLQTAPAVLGLDGARSRQRFSTAVDVEPPPPSPLAALFAKLRERPGGTAAEPAADRVLRDKVVPVAEKAAAVLSKLPDPTLLVLLFVLALLALHVARPHLAPSTGALGVIAAVLGFLPLLPLAAIWNKTDALAALREGINPLSHPAEHAMDDMEAAIRAREEVVARETAALSAARSSLDALRRELAKDPQNATPDALLVPSRRAAAMIAAGALGDSALSRSDARIAGAVRRANAKAQSMLEWRARAEEVQGDVEGTKENIQRLVNHAASVYPARTRELRIRSGASAPPAAHERLRGLASKAFAPPRSQNAALASGPASATPSAAATPPESPRPITGGAPEVLHATPPRASLGGPAGNRSGLSLASGLSAHPSASGEKSKRRRFLGRRRKSGAADTSGNSRATSRDMSEAGS